MRKDLLLNFLKTNKFTLALSIANLFIFFLYYGSEISNITLLKLGANFAPYTLDDDYFRLFSSMFLHGNLLHIIFNIFALFVLGTRVESEIGSFKFLEIYLITGVAAGLVSVYFNLFTVSVGASGAIFGLYGYSVIREFERTDGRSKLTIIINFIIYFVVMLLLGSSFNFDNAAHIGGLAAGLVLGLLDRLQFYRNHRMIHLSWPVMVIIYLVLPRFQPQYLKAFQYMLTKEELINSALQTPGSDEQLADALKKLEPQIDSVRIKFSEVSTVPRKLQGDTAQIHRFLKLKEQLVSYYIKGIERESYIYADSIQFMNYLLQNLPPLRYPLNLSENSNAPTPPDDPNKGTRFTRAYYDEDWYPTDAYSAFYYRVGYKDSLDEWHGRVEDYYKNGAIQMKGAYAHGLMNGIFIYYNMDSTYSAAGRYSEDDRVGKWENFYSNNQLASELRYGDRYGYMINMWDSLGNQLISGGKGTEMYWHPNGQLSYSVEIEDGLRNGFAQGYDSLGNMIYKELFEEGRLVSGISYRKDGSTNYYDGSTMLPFPSGGFEQFYNYLENSNKLKSDEIQGTVVLRFNVHDDGKIDDIRFLKRLGEPFDSYSKELLLNGPSWNPARSHGILPVTSYSEISVEF